jgi:undecaprenyl-diphosphatase
LLTYFLLERVRKPTTRRSVVAAVAVLVAAIGLSRLYLGAHYISDVTAGFLAGGAWLTACIVAYQLARSRRATRSLKH